MSDKYETKPGVRLPRPEDARPKRFYEQVINLEGLIKIGYREKYKFTNT